MKVPNKFANQIMKGRYGASNLLYYVHGSKFMDDLNRVAQCSKWYEISDMEFFQITEEYPDPPTNQGAYFDILLSIQPSCSNKK